MHILRETIGKNCLQITWSEQPRTRDVPKWPQCLPSLLSCIKAFKWFWWAKLPWCNNIYLSYARGWFGPWCAMGSPSPLLEQNSNWCHQEKWLLATPPPLMDWLQTTALRMNFGLLHVRRPADTSGRWPSLIPKRASWDESTAPWQHTEGPRTGQAVGHNGWPITSISCNPHAFPHPSCAHPHSVQSRVVQAKQNNLTSETRIR